jgi:hypothetical protein
VLTNADVCKACLTVILELPLVLLALSSCCHCQQTVHMPHAMSCVQQVTLPLPDGSALFVMTICESESDCPKDNFARLQYYLLV